jgi:3D (Asp-Asp-Asp) domain-containing protein/peptidoglycan hydrolase CwlO-like protein
MKFVFEIGKESKSMCNRTPVRKILAGFTVFLFICTLFMVTAQPLDAITLRELGNSIALLDSEQEKLLEEIIASETIVEAKKNEIKNLDSDLVMLNQQLEELRLQKEELERSIRKKKTLLAEKIIFTYKYGNNDVAKYIISAKNLNEVVNNLLLFKNIMDREAELIETLRFEKEESERISRKSEEMISEKEILKSRLKEEEEKLEKAISENKFLLSKLEQEEKEVQNLLSEIKKRIAAVQPPGIILTGEWEMVATAYYAFGSGGNDINGNGITATGLRARKGIVAVDPGVIPLGTRLFIPGYGEAIAADTGGWIKNNRIDLCFETLSDCYRYGRRHIRVYLVED